MIPDARRRKIKIPVRIEGDRIVPLDSDTLPELKAGATGELIIEAAVLKKPELARELTAEMVVDLLPAGTTVYFGVSRNMIENEARFKLRPPDPTLVSYPYCLVDGIIDEPLQVLARRNKAPTLLGCTCRVPTLGIQAASLNQAFTQISTIVETRRMSHTGNVFTRVFVRDGEFLDLLRNVCQDCIGKARKTA